MKYYENEMITFIKAKFKKLDDPTNIDKYRVAANVTEYQIISKLIFLRIAIPKFIIRQWFYVKNDRNQHVENERSFLHIIHYT